MRYEKKIFLFHALLSHFLFSLPSLFIMMYQKKSDVFFDIVYITLSLLLSTLLILVWIIHACGLHQYIFAKNNSSVSPEKSGIYELNWGVHINEACSEVFYTESDHKARGEGWRYHVYIGNPGHTMVSKSNVEDDIYVTSGVSNNSDIDAFLSRVYQTLDVPEEYHCSTTQNSWYHYQQQDGSILVIIEDSRNCTTYVAEQLI